MVASPHDGTRSVGWRGAAAETAEAEAVAVTRPFTR